MNNIITLLEVIFLFISICFVGIILGLFLQKLEDSFVGRTNKIFKREIN